MQRQQYNPYERCIQNPSAFSWFSRYYCDPTGDPGLIPPQTESDGFLLAFGTVNKVVKRSIIIGELEASFTNNLLIHIDSLFWSDSPFF